MQAWADYLDALRGQGGATSIAAGVNQALDGVMTENRA